MNKKQLIEEMAKCKVCYQEFGKCPIGNKNPCREYTNAKNMYERGYRKVPDGAVILTPEERDEELKACNEKQAELENEIYALKTNYDCLSEHCTDLENKNVAAENMIDRQAKEIEKLKANNESLEMWNDALTKGNEKLEKQNAIANIFLGQAFSHINPDEQIDNYMQASKEGAQEFAKKLKSKLHDLGDGGEKGAYLTENDIDNFLKEFLK